MNFFGILLMSSFALGALWLILLAWWLVRRSFNSPFRKVLLVFVLAGAIIPILLVGIWAKGVQVESIAIVVWPTAIVTMGLEGTPQPVGTVVLFYAFSILGNIGVYGTAGSAIGWLYSQLRAIKQA